MQIVELCELTANEELGLERGYAPPCGHPSPVDEFRGPMLYGGGREGRKRTSAVSSYIHHRQTYHASLWFPFSHFAACRTYVHLPCHLQELTRSGAEHTNESIRALLTIGDINPFKTGGRTPSSSSKVDGSLVCILNDSDKGLTVPEPLVILLAGIRVIGASLPPCFSVSLSRPLKPPTNSSPTSLMDSPWCVLGDTLVPK